jgi:hypothetical protein
MELRRQPLYRSTVYTATLTLDGQSKGYSFAGLPANVFSCAEADTAPGSVSSPAGAGTSITVTIKFPAAPTLSTDLNTSAYGGVAGTLDHIKTLSVPYMNYNVTIDTGPVSMVPYQLWATSAPGLANVSITLKAATDTEITLAPNGSLFSLMGQNASNQVKLVLDNHVILKGWTYNTASLVRVECGDLVMNTDSAVKDNSIDSGAGGVYVSNGTFTMNGGEISGNTASSPGGGGGVYVISTFNKTGPSVIYGDTDTAHTAGSDENTATTSGHAVYHIDGRKRNSTAGPGVNISTDDYGPAYGWE